MSAERNAESSTEATYIGLLTAACKVLVRSQPRSIRVDVPIEGELGRDGPDRIRFLAIDLASTYGFIARVKVEEADEVVSVIFERAG